MKRHTRSISDQLEHSNDAMPEKEYDSQDISIAIVQTVSNALQTGLIEELHDKDVYVIWSIMAHYAENDPRGEYVLVVAGFDGEVTVEENELPADPKACCEHFIAQGLDKKTAMRETAKILGISRREVYQAMLEDG